MGHPNQSFRKIRWKGEESLRTRKNKIDQRTICLHMEVGDLCTLAFPPKRPRLWRLSARSALPRPPWFWNQYRRTFLSEVSLGRKLCEEASAVAICLHHSIICSKEDERGGDQSITTWTPKKKTITPQKTTKTAAEIKGNSQLGFALLWSFGDAFCWLVSYFSGIIYWGKVPWGRDSLRPSSLLLHTRMHQLLPAFY